MDNKVVINALSFDLEEWFQNTHLERYVERSEWGNYESRIEKNVRSILSLLKQKGVLATFFVLGWVAERHPDLIKEISNQGHEIATHGWSHVRIYQQTKEEFETELKRSINLLKNITGKPVLGHRAACFSIVKSNLEWVTDTLMRNGISYDSSIYPVIHDKYGIPGNPRFPYVLREEKGRKLLEFPPSTCELPGKINIGMAGGGYFRIFYPYWLTRLLINRLNQTGYPVMVYLHPPEFDSEQPKLKVDPINNFRIYTGIKNNLKKLKRLLGDFRFAPVKEVLKRGRFTLM
jgi:polysaccharide deacetylase family protein (PEP-CTERM system associated)